MTSRNEEKPAAGLCAQCRHAEIIRTSRASTFYLCGLSQTDTRFPKYPALPVVRCPGFVPVSSGAGRTPN